MPKPDGLECPHCGGRVVVRLAGCVGLLMCVVCDRGEQIQQVSERDLFLYRAKVDSIQEGAR